MKPWAVLVLVPVLLLTGCGSKKIVKQGPAAKPAEGAAPWPAPANALELADKAGLTPETREFVFLHVHSHLDVFVNGNPVTVPAAIGINIKDPAVKRVPLENGTIAYGGINPPCAQPCISPLHTHDTTGLLHTEAKEDQFNTLGEFFTEWNVRLDRNCVGGYCKPAAPFTIYVDGDPYKGDPRTIRLEDGKEIAIVIGTNPSKIPSNF